MLAIFSTIASLLNGREKGQKYLDLGQIYIFARTLQIWLGIDHSNGLEIPFLLGVVRKQGIDFILARLDGMDKLTLVLLILYRH